MTSDPADAHIVPVAARSGRTRGDGPAAVGGEAPASRGRRSSAPFELVKWYLDCVTPDGSVVIGYWASLTWRRLALTWQNVVRHAPGAPSVRRSSLASAAPPDAHGDSIAWRARDLGCEIDVHSRQRPIAERLLDDDTGVVDWRVEAPAAVVSVRLRGFAPVQGCGYAERLRITVPPWRLPIRELRWGRWIDAASNRSVVWIDWRGASPRTWVFVDGIRMPPAVVTDESICAGAARVGIGSRRTLEAMAFSEIADAIPPLAAVAPKALLALRQTRWCSEGTLQDGSAAPLSGRAIHEVVVFR
jgi:hypothetical protein